MEKPSHNSPLVRNLFFITGIIATVAYRIIIILNHYSNFSAVIAWYIGTVGFIVYFYHRYRISEKRVKLIRQYRLDEKVEKLKELNDDEKQVMKYIFHTLKSTKEKWNYICIFFFSFIALIIGFYLDLIKPLAEK